MNENTVAPDRFSKWYIPLVVLALLIAAFAATYRLSESPATWYDEGFFIQCAMNLAENGVQAMQLAPHEYLSSWSISAGYPLMLPIAASFKLFGVSLLHARAVMVLYLILFLVAAYLFMKREVGTRSAVIALFLLATFPVLYGDGKAVLGEVPALFYLMLTLLTLQALERRQYLSRRLFFLAGLSLGLTFAAKYTAMVAVPALLVALFIKRRSLPRDWLSWVLALLGFIAPVLLWVHFQFAPTDSVGLIFGYMTNPYDTATANILPLMLHNMLSFVTQISPLYLLIAFVPWPLSLYLRKKEGMTVSLAEITAFVFTLFILFAYLLSPGWYKYFFLANCVILMFFPFTALYVFRRLALPMPFLRRFVWVPYAVCAALVLLQSYQLSHSSYVAGYYQSTNTSALEAYFSKEDPSKSVFLYNVPEVAVFLPTRNFYQYLNPHINQHFGANDLSALTNGTVDLVVVNKAVYLQDPTPFAKYRVMDTVSRYDILSRQ